MHTKNIISAGKKITEAKRAMILLHGRGATAHDILGLAGHFPLEDFVLFAPQATNNTWYPYSFLAPPSQNEPGLSSALGVLSDLVEELKHKGIPEEKVYIAGFSQGACLAAEFVARHATRYAGIILFTGGLIGDKIYKENYKGDFAGTPIFIGSGDPDAHVPVVRVKETEEVLEKMNAKVTKHIYRNRPHTISQDEIEKVNELMFEATLSPGNQPYKNPSK